MTLREHGKPAAEATTPADRPSITVSVKLFADLRKYMPKGIGGIIDRYLTTRRFIAARKAKADAS